MKILTTSILFILWTVTSFSQSQDHQKLDSLFNLLEKNNKFMGSVAVSKDGEIIYSKSVGFSDVENKIKADQKTKYRIGSVSKTFTTVLVLKAIEEGRLKLSQTIDKYFPSIENADKITIKNLLSHRSGIYNFTNSKEYFDWYTEPKTEDEMIEIISKGGSVFEPDSDAGYSNSNFVLLSYILERTFNKPYSDLLNESIIKPLGLTDTYFNNNVKNESKSYKFFGIWEVEPKTDISVPMGAGGITSTAVDLTKFSDALFNGLLVKPESLELMKTINDGYGIGLFKLSIQDKTGYGHTGGIDGFKSLFYHFNDGNISLALISNAANYKLYDITNAVFNSVYDKPFEIPEFSSYTLTSEDLNNYLGIYASKEIPVKLTITKKGNTLIGQATGQPSFPLEATAKDKFEYDQAGVEMVFNTQKQTLLMKQGGNEFLLTKE